MYTYVYIPVHYPTIETCKDSYVGLLKQGIYIHIYYIYLCIYMCVYIYTYTAYIKVYIYIYIMYAYI